MYQIKQLYPMHVNTLLYVNTVKFNPFFDMLYPHLRSPDLQISAFFPHFKYGINAKKINMEKKICK